MSAIVGLTTLFLVGVILLSSLKSVSWLNDPPNSVTVQKDNENMLRFYRDYPDHRVSNADTEYLKHRSYQ